MDGCASVCTGPSANSPAGTEIKLDQMPYTEEEPELKKELESLSTSVAKPQEMLASLKLQHAAIHATMLDMEELLSTSQTQLTQLAAKVEQVQKKKQCRDQQVTSIRVGEEITEISESKAGQAVTDEVKVHPTTSDAVKAILQRSESDIQPTNKSNSILQKVRETQKPAQKALPPIADGFWPFLTALCKRIIKNPWFECIISLVIIANSVILGVESQMSLDQKNLDWASQAEACFLVVYSLECVLRAIADRWAALRDGWFLFDLILVISAYVEQLYSWLNDNSDQQVMVLRAMRLIRLVRTFRMIRQIRSIWRLVYGLISCGETMISTYALLLLVLYVFGVLGLELIRGDTALMNNEDTLPILQDRFSSLGVTMITLTQFATMDSIADIYLPLIRESPWLIVYFFLLMAIVSISLMNLVTAVIVEGALEHARMDREEEQKLALVTTKQMLPEIVSLFDMVDLDESGEIVLEEMRKFEETRKMPPQAWKILDRASVDSMTDLFEILDVDMSGKVNREEFVEGLLNIFLREVPVSILQMMKTLRLLRETVNKVQVDMDIIKQTVATAMGLSPR